jgi:hypothetical protein
VGKNVRKKNCGKNCPTFHFDVFTAVLEFIALYSLAFKAVIYLELIRYCVVRERIVELNRRR